MQHPLPAISHRQRQYQEIVSQATVNQPLPVGDIAGVMDRLTADFERAYFVTGTLCNTANYAVYQWHHSVKTFMT
jgi:hypothetical protein